jgi:hypothetical protein
VPAGIDALPPGYPEGVPGHLLGVLVFILRCVVDSFFVFK